MEGWIAQLVSGIVGALIGGTLSLLIAFKAIDHQAKKQKEEREKIALGFFNFLLVEQLRHLQGLATERLKHIEFVDQYELQNLQANYSLYERNREQLIYLTDTNLRKEISNLMSQIQTHYWVLNTACNNIATLNAGGVIQGDHGNIKFNENAIDECYRNLSDLMASCEGTLNTFITMDPVSGPE